MPRRRSGCSSQCTTTRGGRTRCRAPWRSARPRAALAGGGGLVILGTRPPEALTCWSTDFGGQIRPGLEDIGDLCLSEAQRRCALLQRESESMSGGQLLRSTLVVKLGGHICGNKGLLRPTTDRVDRRGDRRLLFVSLVTSSAASHGPTGSEPEHRDSPSSRHAGRTNFPLDRSRESTCYAQVPIFDDNIELSPRAELTAGVGRQGSAAPSALTPQRHAK